MQDSSLSVRQTIAVDGELRDAERLIRAGLAALQHAGEDDDFYHLPTLLLASGIERLLKVILWFDQPGPKAFKPGHLLLPLMVEVLNRCFTDEYCTNVPVAQVDRCYLESREAQEFLSFLGEFGQADRYYNLNILLTGNSRGRDPQRVWDSLRLAVLDTSPDIETRVYSGESSSDLRSALIRPYIVLVEKCVRALARLLTLGPIAPNGRRFSSILAKFRNLDDRDLGETAYART